ncbi:MAG: molecular chaperone DnaK [Legionellales bacterium]|nr:molecular chaperone DnaK [Legionellales bacterium]OUX67757.1 MAG: molecular chaperone DnaK [bacterium TMED178]|tara:strand:+ start:1980 stop:3914 length:1935 start_codon:yes stop_codon:yes gene_type:complete
MSHIIGIDLGTTNSCVAVMEKDGKVKVIDSPQGRPTTPSMVAISKDNETLVGDDAKRQATQNPANTIYEVKRLIGSSFEKGYEKDLSYKISKAKNGDCAIEITVDGKKEKWSPEKVSSIILQRMKQTAEEYLGQPVTEAVITVPAYFNDAQRQATKDAGAIAGLTVRRIINEPTAASLAFGLDKAGGDRKIAVYDLGGGTFDVSIIDIANVDGDHQFEVLATNGDTHLGGANFDEVLLEYLASEFKKDQGVDLTKDPVPLQRLKEAAEKAKIELSSTQQTEINLPFITQGSDGQPMHFVIKLTRSKLESLVEDLITRTITPCKTALKDAKLKTADIDDVILVGGQTRMPLVQQKIKEFFKKDARKDINPDQAVAIGAAVQGAVLSGDVKDVLLLDVTPLSLGIETEGGIMTKLIEKNTTIPTKKSQVFSTAANNQTEVTIHVLQGERDVASGNKSLGRFNLSNIPPAPRGMPQIEVTFNIDANGILNVGAQDKATGKEQSIVIKASGGLSEEEIEQMKADAEKFADEDKAFKALVDARNQAESLILGTQKAMTELGDDKIEQGEKEAIEAAIKELEEVVKGDDLESIKSKTEALSAASTKMSERLYANQANQAEAPDQAQSEQAQSSDDVVDADFEEVKDDDKS